MRLAARVYCAVTLVSQVSCIPGRTSRLCLPSRQSGSDNGRDLWPPGEYVGVSALGQSATVAFPVNASPGTTGGATVTAAANLTDSCLTQAFEVTDNGDLWECSNCNCGGVTTAVSVGPAVSLDVFVPPSQPNPNYFGAVQLYLTCPSANFWNQYIGEDELTGLPTNHYSTLRYPLPSPISAMLAGSHPDCFFNVNLNINPTPTPMFLDNLRSTP